MEAATRIRDPRTRQQTIRTLAATWLWKDEAAARPWLETTHELSEAAKTHLLRNSREWEEEGAVSGRRHVTFA